MGSLLPVTRWNHLLRVVACLKEKGLEFKVLHAGSGPLREELEVMARGMHVESVIRFLGHRDDILSLLASPVFLVHRSDVEGLPNAALEPMPCGCAVVGADVGDVPFLIDDGKTLFIGARQDETALVNRMAILLADRELYRRMREAGRLNAEQEFSLEHLVSEACTVY